MAVKRRATEKFRIISLSCDDSVKDLPADQVRLYAMTRKLEDLDLSVCKEDPTIYEAVPLMVKFESALSMSSLQMEAAWNVFRYHIRSVGNMDVGGRTIFEGSDGDVILRDDARDLFAPELVAELSGVIVTATRGFDSAPFSPPDTLLANRTRQREVDALTARIKRA